MILQQSRLKTEFWVEALQTTVYVINLFTSKVIKLQVPQALCSRKTPKYDWLQIFRCEAQMFVPKIKQEKLAPRSKDFSRIRNLIGVVRISTMGSRTITTCT